MESDAQTVVPNMLYMSVQQEGLMELKKKTTRCNSFSEILPPFNQ